MPIAKAQEEGDDGCSSVSEAAISITCDTTFEQVAKSVNNDSVLKSLGNGEYLLSSDLRVDDGARLTIAFPAVKWVKISNQGSPQYSIVVNGYMDIDGVKITSWDPKENSVVYQDSLGSVPRPYIRYQDADGGVIQNSELAHMGYDGGKRRGFSLGGTTTNILIRNNDFHHWWYAFYSAGSKNITIDGNEYRDNYQYAIDPHSGTSDMNITNNHVHHNKIEGIICSEDCSNLLIEGNVVHDHTTAGIFLSKNVHDSIVRNNLIYNSEEGINVWGSPDNEIYNNTIHNVSIAFYFSNPSSGNIGVSTGNKVYRNNVENADFGVASFDTKDNVFSNNTFVNTGSHEFYVWGGSEIKVEDQIFKNYMIAGDTGEITINNSGTVEIGGQNYDTDGAPHARELRNNMTITVNSVNIK